MKLAISIDGAARGNPGPAAAGVVIHEHDAGTVLHKAGYFLGTATNNVAEYQGLLRALRMAGRIGAEALLIHSDSQLMVRQFNGEYKVKNAQLQRHHKEGMTLLGGFGSWQMEHILRQQNTEADRLANMALDAGRDVVVESGEPFCTADKGPAAEQPAALRWSVRLADPPGPQCPAVMQANRRYLFGPCTPDGLCVYAAQAAMEHGSIGPAPHPSTRCAHCSVRLEIEPL